MKTFSTFKSALSLSFVTLTVALALSGCATTQEAEPAPTPEQTQTEQEAPSALVEIQGRAISATDEQLVLRTADGEMTFAIREEDVRAIDPKHIQSHAGIESIGFKVFYRNIEGVDYVVSVEEIDGSTLGFD